MTPIPWDEVAFLRVEEVELLHREGLRVAGGSEGFIDRGRLISAVESVPNGYFGSIGAMAGAYAYRIANAHAFVDGNKRAAYLACWQFVRLNADPEPVLQPEGLEHSILAAAQGVVTESQLVTVVVKLLGRDYPVEVPSW